MRFSQRMGIVPVDAVIQTEGISDHLRASLWNVLDAKLWSQRDFVSEQRSTTASIKPFSRGLWTDFFKKPADTRPKYASQILGEIRAFYFGCAWYQVYDFLEFVLQTRYGTHLGADINRMLERELAGFRVIDKVIVPITDAVEREAVEAALEAGPYAAVREHLLQALQHLGNRSSPDFRNSIKESISAVESLACELSGKPKATLGDALGILERHGKLHGAMRKGFSSLYGYTSDADGIRHALAEEAGVDEADAKYFLVVCASFINYLVAKHAKGQ